MKGKVLMVQGTASSAGKSILVTALCRILKEDGYRVAPFKAQNMALNSFVTPEGGEIGRSQASQAEAACVEPHVRMNPILLKPQADHTSQVIVLGKVMGTMSASEYYEHCLEYLPVISSALEKLREEYDVVLIEGAGSPAEINLADSEIANMRIAMMAESPVLLVADIDRGGVFASIVGTMELLPIEQRELIRGFIINKFRGDVSLLKPGLESLEKRCGKPVLGVIPYLGALGIAQEDSVYLDDRRSDDSRGRPDVCVIRLPHVSNYDDFDPLEPTCRVRYVSSVREFGDPDLIILPGTKTTMADLAFLRETGIADEVVRRAGGGAPVIGVCGGYQMLGRRIRDLDGTESDVREMNGLGLLDVETVFEADKVTSQVKATVVAGSGLLSDLMGTEITGYEIHMGRTERSKESPAFLITESNGRRHDHSDGDIDRSGTVLGTYVHGLFNNPEFTRGLIENVCRLRGVSPVEHQPASVDKAYASLAAAVRASIDMKRVYEIISGGAHGV